MSSRVRLRPENRGEEMAAALRSGLTTLAVAAMFGVTRQAVQRAGKSRGVRSKWRPGKPAKSGKETETRRPS